jgi:2-hydroxy-3-keto-5-methylthiopentenyl-1-phosphate phosphatase
MLIVCDFDGSAASQNGAQTVLEQFVDADDSRGIKGSRTSWINGDFSFRVYQENAFRRTGASVEEIGRLASELIDMRKGFAEMVSAADEAGARFLIASAGLDSYIRPALQSAGHTDTEIVSVMVKDGTDRENGDGLTYEYPPAEQRCDPDWAVCKCHPMTESLERGEEVIFVGDGLRSDACAAEIATKVFARDRLLDSCRERKIPDTPYDDLSVIADYIRSAARRKATVGKPEQASQK